MTGTKIFRSFKEGDDENVHLKDKNECLFTEVEDIHIYKKEAIDAVMVDLINGLEENRYQQSKIRKGTSLVKNEECRESGEMKCDGQLFISAEFKTYPHSNIKYLELKHQNKSNSKRVCFPKDNRNGQEPRNTVDMMKEVQKITNNGKVFRLYCKFQSHDNEIFKGHLKKVHNIEDEIVEEVKRNKEETDENKEDPSINEISENPAVSELKKQKNYLKIQAHQRRYCTQENDNISEDEWEEINIQNVRATESKTKENSIAELRSNIKLMNRLLREDGRVLGEPEHKDSMEITVPTVKLMRANARRVAEIFQEYRQKGCMMKYDSDLIMIERQKCWECDTNQCFRVMQRSGKFSTCKFYHLYNKTTGRLSYTKIKGPYTKIYDHKRPDMNWSKLYAEVNSDIVEDDECPKEPEMENSKVSKENEDLHIKISNPEATDIQKPEKAIKKNRRKNSQTFYYARGHH